MRSQTMPIAIAPGFVCVSNGDAPPSPQSSWVARTVEAGGKTFVYCDREASRFSKLVNRDFRMLDALVAARNSVVTTKMAAVGRDRFDVPGG